MSRLIRISAPVSSPKCLEDQSLAALASKATAMPTPMPPAASQMKMPDASTMEKVPVTAAAMAKRRQTSPEASFSRDSPSKMHNSRLGMGVRTAMADTATASVGESTAASAKAIANGMAGISQ